MLKVSQKSVESMFRLTYKFVGPKELVIETSAGTQLTENYCLQLSE